VLYTSSLIGRGSVGHHELGPLLVFAIDEVQAGSGFNMHAHENVDVLTVVLQGSLDQEDTAGLRAHINVGEAALMSAGTGVKHAEFADRDEPTRSATIWFTPRTMGKTPAHTTGKPVEKDGWQLIAAEHDAPLTLEQDARVLMKRLAAHEQLPLLVQPARLLYVAIVDGGLVAGEEGVSAPERIILREGTSIRSDAGATIVVVDVPSPER
jgi:redox-sensitive bicupin YhaK (pirin superfamily)